MKAKKHTGFLVVQVEGADQNEVQRLVESLNKVISSAIEIHRAAKSLDMSFAPEAKVLQGKG